MFIHCEMSTVHYSNDKRQITGMSLNVWNVICLGFCELLRSITGAIDYHLLLACTRKPSGLHLLWNICRALSAVCVIACFFQPFVTQKCVSGLFWVTDGRETAKLNANNTKMKPRIWTTELKIKHAFLLSKAFIHPKCLVVDFYVGFGALLTIVFLCCVTWSKICVLEQKHWYMGLDIRSGGDSSVQYVIHSM